MSATKPQGVTGVSAPSGFVTQREQNPSLRWPFDVGTAVEPGAYERMSRTDPTVAACVMAVVLPIAQADWEISEPEEPEEIADPDAEGEEDEAAGEADEEDPEEGEPAPPPKKTSPDDEGKGAETDAPAAAEDLEEEGQGDEDAEAEDPGEKPVDPITAFVRAAFQEHLRPGMQKTIADVVRSAVVNGHHVVEPIFRLLEDGPFAGKVTLRTLAPRPAWTIERWLLDDAGELVGVVQGAPTPTGTWARPELRAEEILVFTYDQQGGDPRGQSALRPIFLVHKVKELLIKLIGVRNEREALGMPIAEVPHGFPDKEMTKLRASLRGWRAHEEAFIIVPQDVKVHLPEGRAGAAQAIRDDLAALDLQIRTAVLQHFQALGTTETGSRSVGEIHAALFYLALVAIAELVVDQFNLLIERLVDLNFGPQERYPYFTAPKIRAEDVMEALRPIAEAVEKKLITADETVEQRAREALGLPPAKKKLVPPALQEMAEAAAAGDAPPPPPGKGNAPATPAAAQAAARAAMHDRPRQGELAFHGGFAPKRMLSPVEKRVAFAEISARFDNAAPELQHVVGNAIRGNRSELIAWARPLARRALAGDEEALQELERKDLPRAVRAAIVRAVQGYADDLHAFGREQARRERRLAPAVAQREARRVAHVVRDEIPAAPKAPDAVAALDDRGADDDVPTTGGTSSGGAPKASAPVRAEAAIQGDRIADELLRLMRLTVARAAARQPRALARHPDPESRDPYAAVNYVVDELEGVVTAASENLATVRDSAMAISVKAFSGGRREVFEQHADEIESVSYSSVMDGLQCQECEHWDERSAPSLDAAEDGGIPPTPNPSCFGTAERCRCIWVVNYR